MTMTEPRKPDCSVPDLAHPPRLQLRAEPGAAAVSGELQPDALGVQQDQTGAPATDLRLALWPPGSHRADSFSTIPTRSILKPHSRLPPAPIFSSSASFPRRTGTFTFRALETLDTSHTLQDFSRLPISGIHSESPDIDSVTTMFTSLQTPSGQGHKRCHREVDGNEPEQLQQHVSERRIARARDISASASLAATSISENRIGSSSFFLPSAERSSPPRPRSNALSTQPSIITPSPSDTEDLYNNDNNGFAKPLMSLLSRKATGIPFSAAQSPAESFTSSQAQTEDSQDVSMNTEDSQNDSLMDMDMDMDMDDAPQFSQQSAVPQHSLPYNNPPNTAAASPFPQATNFLAPSARLPTSAYSQAPSRDGSPSTELENFGQMGIHLAGAQQDSEGKWRVPSGSKNLGHVANGMGTSKPQPKQRAVMGYRADCDKCRRKVPGHFMHII